MTPCDPSLVLFDIDATLIVTGGVGIQAMVDAGRELFTPGFHANGIEYAGRLDPLIVRDMLRVNAVDHRPAHVAAFRDGYRRHLQRHLAVAPKRALPGVRDLLAALGSAPGVALGLLTGNYEETGCLKLRACGIAPDQFVIRAWGDESPHAEPSRDHLPPIALDRYHQRFGRRLAGEAVTVIGDTPHDVACARASGCRVVAVATGKHSMDELRACGPDLLVPNLADTEGLLAFLLRGPRAGNASRG